MVKSHALVEHLKKEHQASTLQTHLKEIVYGGNDGIVTTFAVVAGFAGSNLSAILPHYSYLTVLLFGLANLFADGSSMGLGNFLSLRAEKDVYESEKKKELNEIRNSPQMEKKETIDILLENGFSKDQAEKLTEIYATNENYWASFMMNYELEMSNPEKTNPISRAVTTFLSFVFFGFIPLLPYVFLPIDRNTFYISLFATFSALVLLGILRWLITKGSPFRCIFEIVLIGGVAASIAYIVGTFFKI